MITKSKTNQVGVSLAGLFSIVFIKHSCAKTLSRKFNLYSRAQVFNKFGSNLSAPAIGPKGKPLALSVKNSYKHLPNYRNKAKPITYDPLESLRLRTQINFLEPC